MNQHGNLAVGSAVAIDNEPVFVAAIDGAALTVEWCATAYSFMPCMLVQRTTAHARLRITFTRRCAPMIGGIMLFRPSRRKRFGRSPTACRPCGTRG
jgi:hypothetical protein